MYYKNWEVQLHCHGTSMEEFDARIEDDWTVSCWAPSEAGKTFSVHWRNESDYVASADTFVDGQHAGRSTAQPFRTGQRLGTRTSPSTLSAFAFALLEVTDDDAPDALGSIELGIFRVASQYRVRPQPYEPMRMSDVAWRHDRSREGAQRKFTGEKVLVHERSKKAGTHCISLGQGWHAPLGGGGRDQWRYRYIERADEPYVKFVFRYKPRVLLQADGIIAPGAPRLALQSMPFENARDSLTCPSTCVKQSPFVALSAEQRSWGVSDVSVPAGDEYMRADNSMKEEVPPTPDLRMLPVIPRIGRYPIAMPRKPERSALGMSSFSAIDVDAELIDLTHD